MSVQDAIEKLEASNKEQKVTLEQFHEQFVDIRTDPRFVDLPIDDLENLFLAYLKTRINTNTEIIELLVESKNNL